MKKKRFSSQWPLLLCFVLISFATQAQVGNRDVIYLKNGSIIKGLVLEMIPGGNIKIQTADGSVFIYPLDEVVKTEKEVMADQKSSKSSMNGEFNYRGYFMMTRIGPLINPDSDNGVTIVPSFINGYQITEYLSLGVGIETMNYEYSYGQGVSSRFVPIFFDTRFYIPRHRVHPMFSFQFGYSVGGKTKSVNNQNQNYYDFVPNGKGGTFMSVGAGMRVFITQQISFVWDGGLGLQSMKGQSGSYGSYYSESKTVPLLRMNVGLAFNLGKNTSSKKAQ